MTLKPETDRWSALCRPLQGILLYCDHHASTFDLDKLPCDNFEAMDHFAKCFLILRLEDRQVEGGVQRLEGQDDGRSWRAVRVDVVAPPMERYAFALLGWTGSRVRTAVIGSLRLDHLGWIVYNKH